MRSLGVDPSGMGVAQMRDKIEEINRNVKLGLWAPPEFPIDNHRHFKKKDVLRLIFGSKTEFDETLSVYAGKSTFAANQGKLSCMVVMRLLFVGKLQAVGTLERDMELHAGFKVDDLSDQHELQQVELYPDPRVRRNAEQKEKDARVARLEDDRQKFLELEERRRELFSRKFPVAPDGG